MGSAMSSNITHQSGNLTDKPTIDRVGNREFVGQDWHRAGNTTLRARPSRIGSFCLWFSSVVASKPLAISKRATTSTSQVS